MEGEGKGRERKGRGRKSGSGGNKIKLAGMLSIFSTSNNRNMNSSLFAFFGALVAVLLLALLMPSMRRGAGGHKHRNFYGPYYSHGGRQNKPGVLY